MIRNELFALVIATIILIVGLSSLRLCGVWELNNKINNAQIIEIIISFVLVLITAIYVKRTADIADATKKQAQEVREQRIMASRPTIVQKAIYEKDVYQGSTSESFLDFEIWNAGNGPAIELEISLLDRNRNGLLSRRESFLRAGELSRRFNVSDIINREDATYYLVSEYQSTLPHGEQKTWYQTWLPFEKISSSKTDKIYVKPGELEFREVSEKDRINAFRSSKPK